MSPVNSTEYDIMSDLNIFFCFSKLWAGHYWIWPICYWRRWGKDSDLHASATILLISNPRSMRRSLVPYRSIRLSLFSSQTTVFRGQDVFEASQSDSQMQRTVQYKNNGLDNISAELGLTLVITLRRQLAVIVRSSYSSRRCGCCSCSHH